MNDTGQNLYLGTSNIVVPGKKQDFPEGYRDKSRLHYYSSYCNSIEINSSFYKVPLKTTFEKWANEVPGDFRFTIKLWREITHVKELKFDPEKISHFINSADGLGAKKGCLLVQFPGKISLDYYSPVEDILTRLHEEAKGWSISLELRNPGWYIPETFELLDHIKATLVVHDKSKGKNDQPNRNSDFIYLRYHGPEGDYRGSYPDEFLKEQAKLIRGYLQSGKTVYAYFNNTMGPALENLNTLKDMIKEG